MIRIDYENTEIDNIVLYMVQYLERKTIILIVEFHK